MIIMALSLALLYTSRFSLRLFIVTTCLVGAVQPCAEFLSQSKKQVKNKFWKLYVTSRSSPSYKFYIPLQTDCRITRILLILFIMRC